MPLFCDPFFFTRISTIWHSAPKTSSKIDLKKGEPNIEVISDYIDEALLTLSKNDKLYKSFVEIRNDIRKIIVNIFISNEHINLENHIKFIKALKTITNNNQNVWIFTTNYDLLFEAAACLTKTRLENCFVGAHPSFFAADSIKLMRGTTKKNVFSPQKELTLNLLKLHGSINWWKNKDITICDNSITNISEVKERVMILPRKMKIRETLENPFDEIFRVSHSILGDMCKYLVSCGFSFGDEHINTSLLIPKLREGSIRLTALMKEKLPSTEAFDEFPSFNYITSERAQIFKEIKNEFTDIWKFSEFVNFLASHTGN